MTSAKILLIISVVVLLVIYFVNRHKKMKKNFVDQAPLNLGLQALLFFEQLLAFLPQINAELRKGGSVLDGSILVRGKEQGTYMFSEDGGWITYLGVSSYFSLNSEGKASNAAGEQLLFFTLSQFIKNTQEARDFFDHLSEDVLNLNEQENVIETQKMQFRFVCQRNYSETPKAEIPAALQHIERPLVFTLEIIPVATVEP